MSTRAPTGRWGAREREGGRGGRGNDVLTGGAGNDVFRFADTLGSTNVDTVTDWAVGDSIQLENAIFTRLTTTGVLASTRFAANANGLAMDANDHVVYNTTTGALSYDADGSGAGAAVQFATLVGIPTLSAADFTLTCPQVPGLRAVKSAADRVGIP